MYRPLKRIVHPTYKRCSFDRPNCIRIRSTNCVHPTYKSCAYNLQKWCIRLTKVVYPTYKKCASDLQMYKFVRNRNSDPQQCQLHTDKICSLCYSCLNSDVEVGPKFRIGQKYCKMEMSSDRSNMNNIPLKQLTIYNSGFKTFNVDIYCKQSVQFML